MYLFINTETSGLPRNWKAPMHELSAWPRLVQIAWQYYDENGEQLDSKNYLIKPDRFTIPRGISRMHGITTEMAQENGVDLPDVLQELNDVVEKTYYVVAFNMTLVDNVVGAEFIRKKIHNKILSREKIYLMEKTIKFCEIIGPYGYRRPKLYELYYKVFDNKLSEIHNIDTDLDATVQCFFELKKQSII